MERSPVSIPRSEIPAEAIRYSDVKTQVEIASEATPEVNFRNANIRILYEDLYMSAKSVGRAVGLSIRHTYELLHNQGIEMRSSYDQEYVRRRGEGVRRVYEDPERKVEVVAKIHKPGSDEKRANSLRQRYEADPEYRARQLGYVRSAVAANIRASADRRIQRAETMNELTRTQRDREVQFAQSLYANPAFRMLSKRQRQVIELRFRTDGGSFLTLRQVGEALGGISRQAVQQYETKALVTLGVLKQRRK